MPDHQELILDHLKELRQDHKDVSSSIAELKNEVRNLAGSIERLDERLTEVDRTLHTRIDKKDDKSRDLEERQHADELKFTALESKIETNSRNNKWWIGIGISICIVVATATPFIIKALQG